MKRKTNAGTVAAARSMAYLCGRLDGRPTAPSVRPSLLLWLTCLLSLLTHGLTRAPGGRLDRHRTIDASTHKHARNSMHTAMRLRFVLRRSTNVGLFAAHAHFRSYGGAQPFPPGLPFPSSSSPLPSSFYRRASDGWTRGHSLGTGPSFPPSRPSM